VACGSGILSALGVLCHWNLPFDFRVGGFIPFGEFFVGVDFLSAFFLLLFFILSLAAGVYGYGYLRDYAGRRSVGTHFALYQLLVAVIVLVLVAKNAVLFLVAWELMTFVSYFLIIFYNEKESVRKAGYIYLIATHTGAFCLLVMFLLMGAQAGSTNFDQMSAAVFPSGLAALIFVLGLFGFGVKAGFIPLHIWLPHAHPAAPTHISALLSGVVIKIGIYGLMRIILIVKDFPSWCGVLLLTMAAISGVGGVLYALGQHEIKKLLAYHSIENIGIIMLGLGVGLMGHAYHMETVALIGYAAALLHTFNHAMFKGLLFLSAGSVIRATHTGEMDHMGGLLKRLPWTGHLFLIGSLSICGLPFFNGFISEWLVYRGLLEGVFHLQMYGVIFSSLAVVALALIGGLAALCFAKAFGVIFLGRSRAHEEHPFQEGDLMLRGPMTFLAGICVWGGLFPLTMVSFAFQGAQAIAGFPVPLMLEQTITYPLLVTTQVLFAGVIIFVILAFLRECALRAHSVRLAETWVCGYSNVSARMQYTASSFARPILMIFRAASMFKIKIMTPAQYFPAPMELSSSVKDASEHLFFRPVFYLIKMISRRLKWIQSGHTQNYILYILFLLVFLLIWKLR
jgi:formate hydrogenlyase subunit 3/multisubunit Na+/H+ antiporter MnhD subunit